MDTSQVDTSQKQVYVMQREDYERMATLETEINSLKSLVVQVNLKLDVYATNFVPRQELAEMFKNRDDKIADIKENAKSTKAMIPAYVGMAMGLISMLITLIKSFS